LENNGRGLRAAAPSAATKVPLFIDLDGTLVRSDLLLEGVLALLRRSPLQACLLPLWLIRGKSYLKQQVAQHADIDVAGLPYDASLVEFLKAEHARGRTLVLATASHRSYAEPVARHLGIFAAVLATDGTINLSGAAKLQAILAHTGGREFEYAANARQDIEIWARAHGAVVVNASPGVLGEAHRVTRVTRVFQAPAAGWQPYWRALRIHHWAKNLLLFVPLLTAHQWANAHALWQLAPAFLTFSLCASGVYLLNDLLDAPADRQHPRKRARPVAAGAIVPAHAVALALSLPLGAILIAAFITPKFMGALLAYLVLAAGYSLYFRRYALLDVLVLAGLHTLRVAAGAIAIEVPLSFWLLAFSVFLFFSVALVKRCAELRVPGAGVTGRDYAAGDLPHLRGMGMASGYVAVLVFALYINSADVAVRYTHPEWLWLSCPALLYWVSRAWIREGRGEMHDDPLIYALRDPASYVVLAAMLAAVLLAL
jgi:4-hydroxybenzoate polyprenyltransferase